MNQENKELLLKDLSARLPYGVKCTTKSSWNGIYTIIGYKDNSFFLDCPVYGEGDDEWMIESIVPYLRPMSSMTKEERQEYLAECDKDDEDSITTPRYHGIEWLNKNGFDYRGLIERGLAIIVTEENNPYKE